MGKTTRRKFTPEFKAKVALDALKESSTKGQLAKKHDISPEMISRMKERVAGDGDIDSVIVNEKRPTLNE